MSGEDQITGTPLVVHCNVRNTRRNNISSIDLSLLLT